jgi:hypothetical protein
VGAVVVNEVQERRRRTGSRLHAHAHHRQAQFAQRIRIRTAAWRGGRHAGTGELAFGDRLDDFKGNMRELRTLRFTCSACGSRDWRGWLFIANEAEAWIEGLTVSLMGGDGPTF